MNLRCLGYCLVNELFVYCLISFVFFFQAEDGIRDYKVTGVQTCALPIYDTRPAFWAGGKDYL